MTEPTNFEEERSKIIEQFAKNGINARISNEKLKQVAQMANGRDSKFTPERLRDTLFEQIRRVCLCTTPTDASTQTIIGLASAINKSIEVECLTRAQKDKAKTEST